MIDYYETKQHPITKKMVLDAYKVVRANKGSAGVDDESLDEFATNATGNLYKLWNRLTSGSYHPPAVKEVAIPKRSKGIRYLGIPSVSDRIAQQVVKSYIEPKIEIHFHENSYGYRPRKSAHHALRQTTVNCSYYGWAVDLDIKSFFDSIDHELLMKAIRCFVNDKWVLMYIERWLKAGVSRDGVIYAREKGTPQGGVISPILANVFMHFVFDKWMEKNHPNMPFERYCDDAIIHCTTERQASFIKSVVAKRLAQCKLELNDAKTHIVYCRNHVHREYYPNTRAKFDFLGYTFRPIRFKSQEQWKFSFLPCMSESSKNEVRITLRKLIVRGMRYSIEQIAEVLNPKIRGWYQYYHKFTTWTTRGLWYWLNQKLANWIKNYRRTSIKKARDLMVRMYETRPHLFAHWVNVRPYR
ncbi:group II intron reverse transcriptase/maturase [Niastella sp. OAS944]|uniref:group II intron reverse transcriptase/maturase n=1 Tax=Niastella sp. OAS944 TaxID=2664089 RepID=UPI00346BB841|nr:group II intron reverse transcriptase/maturase [Chitinophagaceae bacterium OAS944]